MAGANATAMLNGEVLVDSKTVPQSAEVHEQTKNVQPSKGEQHIDCDVLVIGAGFSGITAIHRFRKLGMNVKCFESGTDFGGVWYWNRYPGARVDSEAPFYQLNIPEAYRHWNFKERFPDHRELREYMAHLDKTLDLRRDTTFNARVNDCTWDQNAGQWTVKTLQGHSAKAKYLICATGLLHRTYTPNFEGLKDYKGEVYHSGAWPEDFDPKGKKIGLIGAGATAVQITQELGKAAKELTVFLRRPSYCLAMKQRPLPEVEQRNMKPFYPTLFDAGRKSRAGFPAEARPEGVLDVTKQDRETWLDEMWERGGFHYMLSGFSDTLVNKEANEVIYQYWRKKICERLTDPEKQKIMCPEEKPYYFGTKRSPLEQDYYEVLDQSNVKLHDLNQAPLKAFTQKGLLMSDGTEYEFDAVALATGFDSYSGSMTQMGLKNKDGVDLRDLWKDGVHSYLGLTINGFPNMFMVYTPQAPTSLSNGPTIIEAQMETAVDMIKKLEEEKAVSIEATKQAEMEWAGICDGMAKYTLIPYTDSWWNGANIPGKKAQGLIYVGGINMYEPQMRATMEDWKGFDVVSAKA